jgi:hypothetical protein
MDPYLNSLAFKLLAETPEEESNQHREPQSAWDKKLRHQLGGVLVTLGQRIQAGGLEVPVLFEDIGCPSLENEMHLSR